MSERDDASPTRRDFMTLAVAPAMALLGPQAAPDGSAGRQVGRVPLSRPGAVPLNRLLGRGLDARLSTDLSQIGPDALLTPNEQFYIRTARPAAAAAVDSWAIAIGGMVRTATVVSAAALQQQARPMGVCLLECSGNGDPDNFGLMSTARWNGVPLRDVLAPLALEPGATRVRISGVDDPVSPSRTSVPGASWIFALDDLRDAFLATGMNDQPLPSDHGAPVRLVVPGWYGCTCIKWVDRIDMVDDRAPATPHMLEFAGRTHQPRDIAFARDFLPARIEHAAMPIRVEQWLDRGRTVYKIVGILWGGRRPVNQLAIRFGANDPFVPVDDCPLPHSTVTWSLWSHWWRPATRGRYEIALRVTDPSVPTRRLDALFYRRVVDITEAS